MKKTLSLLVIVFCVLALPSLGEDITTLSGKTYSNVTITRVEPDGITIKHSAGLIKLFFGELPEDVRARYGADPVKARNYQEERRLQQMKVEVAKANRDMLQRVEAQAIMVHGTVDRTVEEGIYLDDAITPVVTTNKIPPKYGVGKVEEKVSTRWVRLAPKGKPVFVIGAGGLIDGADCKGVLYPAGQYRDSYGSIMNCYTFTAAEAVSRLLKGN
jgi:hypothetical protein